MIEIKGEVAWKRSKIKIVYLRAYFKDMVGRQWHLSYKEPRREHLREKKNIMVR